MGIRAGKAIHEAIKDGIAYIKANHKGIFDEDAYTKEMEKQHAPNERSEQEKFQSEREGANTDRSSSETGSRNSLQRETKGKEVIPKINRLGKLGGITEPTIDRIADLNDPQARKLADAAKAVENQRQFNEGETVNHFLKTVRESGFTRKDGEQLNKIADWENRNGRSIPNNSPLFRTVAQRKVWNAYKAADRIQTQRQLDLNQPVIRGGNPTKLQVKPWYNQTPLSSKTADLYTSGKDKNAIAQKDKEFIDNAKQYGKTPEQAAKLLSDFKSTLAGSMVRNNPNMTFFGGSRMAHDIPLPKTFTHDSFTSRVETLLRRKSLDSAFFQHIESKPDIMASLGETKGPWGEKIAPGNSLANTPPVRSWLDTIQGEVRDSSARAEGSITALASTLFVSNPVVEMHKILSNTINGAISLASNPIEAMQTFGHMITHISDGIEHASENGLTRMTAKSVGDFFERGTTFAERMQALSQGFRNMSSLGGLTSKINDGMMQSSFEFAIPNVIKKANAGNVDSQYMLKKWDPSYTVGKNYSTKDIQQLASLAAGYTHGTGDSRTMPPWMMKDTELSGFFKLAHWSVAQTNRFMSDIYTPATRGNFVPLLNGLLGSAVGGYVIRQLREQLQGKHGNIPDLNELASTQSGLSGNKGLVAYNLISALQYAGFAGILSQGLKFPVDRMMKNNPQGAVFPLDEIASDLMKQIGDFTSAKANDPNFDWADASVALLNHILTDNIQLTRIGFNQGVNVGLITGTQADKKILSDKLGQLRRFDMASNLPYDDQEPAQANAYMNIEQKKFKMNQDIPSAMQELPGLVNNIIQTYGDRPDVMMGKLKALKQESYEVFPDIKTKAPSLMKYMNYLITLKGKDEADSEYMDYIHHKIINEAKASVVP